MSAAANLIACATCSTALAERAVIPRASGSFYRDMNHNVRKQHTRLGCFLCSNLFCSCQFQETVFSFEPEEVRAWGKWQRPWYRLQDRYICEFHLWEESTHPRMGPGKLRSALQLEWSVLFEHCLMATGRAALYRTIEFRARTEARAKQNWMAHMDHVRRMAEVRARQSRFAVNSESDDEEY